MKIPNILLLAGVAVGIVACGKIFGNQDAPIPYNLEDPLKAGEISLSVRPDPVFGWAPPSGSVNLGGLKSKSGGEPVLIALGEGVAAGYRDGGLFREGQITSYPNLVARQMGLANFKQPLFERENGNGTGRLALDKSLGFIRWNEVTNNLAHKEKGSLEFKPYTGGPVNNYSAPGLNPSFFWHNPSELLADQLAYYRNNPPEPIIGPTAKFWDKQAQPMALASRFVPPGTGSGWDHISAMQPDLGIVEAGMDFYLLNFLSRRENGLQTGQRAPGWELTIINSLKKEKVKFVYATIPDVLDFPYFNLYTYNDLVKKNGSTPKGGRILGVGPDDILLPTRYVVNYFNGKITNINTRSDIIIEGRNMGPELYNQYFIKGLAQQNGHPVVDFYAVYKRVIAGAYVSEDGFKIDPSFPNGNFFSSDGIYPSAIGQAVLANEVIKVFNASYGMQIPLIDLGRYAAELGKN